MYLNNGHLSDIFRTFGQSLWGSEETTGGFCVIFRKDVYTEEYLRGLGLNERQIRAVMYVKERGRITNREYQEIGGVKERLATLELRYLVEKNVLEKHGATGGGTYYTLKKEQKAQESCNEGAFRDG
jgi:ATP-dependent DNA helicase RecG